MTVHELKTWPAYFAEVDAGAKTFEIRRDDRPFAIGDELRLREWGPDVGDHDDFGEPMGGRYTGREISRRVTYVLRDAEAFGLKAGFVILGLAA